MADYNSAYTGPEVDAALAKTEQIMEFVQVYAGSPTNTGVPLSVLPVNPGTGSKTGVYDIIYAATDTDPDDPGATGSTSRLYVGNESGTYNGAGTVQMTDTAIASHHVMFNDSGSLTFEALYSLHDFGSGTATHLNLYIHKIYRLQEIT